MTDLFVPDPKDPKKLKVFLEETIADLRTKPASAQIDANIGQAQEILNRLEDGLSQNLIELIEFINQLAPEETRNDVATDKPKRAMGFNVD